MRPGPLFATAKFLSLRWARTWQKQGRFQFFNRRIFDADVDNAKALLALFCANSSDCPMVPTDRSRDLRKLPVAAGLPDLCFRCGPKEPEEKTMAGSRPVLAARPTDQRAVATRAVRDRLRRRISPAPAHAAQQRGGLRTGPKNLRADCRRIVP